MIAYFAKSLLLLEVFFTCKFFNIFFPIILICSKLGEVSLLLRSNEKTTATLYPVEAYIYVKFFKYINIIVYPGCTPTQKKQNNNDIFH